jgi:hypothetical protein
VTDVITSDEVRLYAEATGAGLPLLFIHEFAAQLAEHSAEGMALTVAGIQRSRPSLYDITGQLAGIGAPTLVVNGDEDEACLEPCLLLKRTIPTAGLAVVPNSGHALNLEEPELFNDLIRTLAGAAEAGAWPTRDPQSRSTSMGIAHAPAVRGGTATLARANPKAGYSRFMAWCPRWRARTAGLASVTGKFPLPGKETTAHTSEIYLMTRVYPLTATGWRQLMMA